MKWLRTEWDRVLGFTCIALGAFAVVLAYLGVSDSPYVSEALSYTISGGVGGLFLLGVGATLLISADLHDEWCKLDDVAEALRGGPSQTERPVPGEHETTTAPANGRATATASAPTAVAYSAPATPAGDSCGTALAAPTDRVRMISLLGCVAALLVVGVGWNHTATTADTGRGVIGLAVAVVGLGVVGLTATLSTTWLKRAVRLRTIALVGPLRPPREAAADVAHATADWSADRVLVADGLTRYHCGHCPALAGVTPVEIARQDVPPGLAPCGLCGAN